MHLTDALSVLEYANPEGYQDIVINLMKMIMEGAPMISLYAFSQVKPQMFLKVFAAVFSTNGTPVSFQPVLIVPNPKYSVMAFFALPKFHWFLEKSSAVSLQARNDAHYFFGAVPIRMRSVYLILLSISKLDLMSRCSNTPTVRSRIVLTTVVTS